MEIFHNKKQTEIHLKTNKNQFKMKNFMKKKTYITVL